MWFPQEEKDEEAIDFDDEEEEADDVLADLPQKSKPPDKREMKRMSTLSSLFNRGNKVSNYSIDRMDFLMLYLYDCISHLPFS